MNTEEYLNTINKLNLLIDNMLMEKEELFALATKVTYTPNGMPRPTGTSDRTARYVVMLHEKDVEIENTLCLLLSLKSEIIGQIQKLPAKEYDILYKSYILGISLNDIATYKDRHISTIKKIRQNGIANLKVLWSDNLKEAMKLLQ